MIESRQQHFLGHIQNSNGGDSDKKRLHLIQNASTSFKNPVVATANSQRKRVKLKSPQRIPWHDRVAGFRIKVFQHRRKRDSAAPVKRE